MAIKWTVTYPVTSPTGVDYEVRGTGDTEADAKAEADAKLKVQVALTRIGDPDGPTARVSGPGEVGTPATGEFASAVIVFAKGSGFTDKPARYKHLSTAYKIPGSKGLIDGTNADIMALAAGFEDGDGEKGYYFKEGYFVQ